MKTFKQLQERLGGKGYKPYTSLTGKKVSGDWEDSDRGAGNKAKRRAGEKVKAKSPTYLAHVHNKKLKEHHQTDANGKVIEHGDGTPSSVEEQQRHWSKGYDSGDKTVPRRKALDRAEYFDNRGENQRADKIRRIVISKDHGDDYEARRKAKNIKIDDKKVGKLRPASIDDKRGAISGDIPKKLKGVKEDYYKGTGEKVQARTKKWMDKKGQKGAPGLDAMKARTAEHKAKRGVKEEADAYKYVVSKLKKKYGSGVLTKGDKIKPQSAADKAKARAHQAKVDAENAAERAKDPSQGRYPKGYSNRGSD